MYTVVGFLPMSKGNYMCALRSFFLVRFLQYPTPTNQSFTSSHHRRHCPRAFDHGRERRFPHLRTPTPPRKGGGSPPCPITDGQHITPRNPVQSGQRLPQSSDSTPERQGFPPVQSEGDRYRPTKPCPIRAKITSEDRSPHPVRGRDKNRWVSPSVRWS